MNKKIKLLIVGHGRHGKDTMAEILNKHFKFEFMSSSMAASKIFLFDALKEKYGYKTFKECYEDRSNKRDEWYELITKYNSEDRNRLAKKILEECDCYVGMRNPDELLQAKETKLFDLIVWVDASERLPLEPASSMGITKDMADVIIDNNSTLEQFVERVTNLRKLS